MLVIPGELGCGFQTISPGMILRGLHWRSLYPGLTVHAPLTVSECRRSPIISLLTKRMSGRAAERDSARKDYHKQIKSVGKKYQAQQNGQQDGQTRNAKNFGMFRKLSTSVIRSQIVNQIFPCHIMIVAVRQIVMTHSSPTGQIVMIMEESN